MCGACVIPSLRTHASRSSSCDRAPPRSPRYVPVSPPGCGRPPPQPTVQRPEGGVEDGVERGAKADGVRSKGRCEAKGEAKGCAVGWCHWQRVVRW
eukprot:scaffold39853_cov30-Phaeocystis_antarctica.AAC.2